ncbi:MAG: hypothetical protein ACHQ17_09070, partial [Polyangia bacterium]
MRVLSVFGWLFGLLFAGCAFYVVFTFSFAFLGRAQARRAHVLRAALIELLVTLVMMPLWPLWWLIGASYQASV